MILLVLGEKRTTDFPVNRWRTTEITSHGVNSLRLDQMLEEERLRQEKADALAAKEHRRAERQRKADEQTAFDTSEEGVRQLRI